MLFERTKNTRTTNDHTGTTTLLKFKSSILFTIGLFIYNFMFYSIEFNLTQFHVTTIYAVFIAFSYILDIAKPIVGYKYGFGDSFRQRRLDAACVCVCMCVSAHVRVYKCTYVYVRVYMCETILFFNSSSMSLSPTTMITLHSVFIIYVSLSYYNDYTTLCIYHLCLSLLLQ